MRSIAAAVLGLSLLPAGCGGGTKARAEAEAPAPAAPAPGSVEEAARAVLEQYRQAHEVRSLDALAPLYLEAPELVRVWQGERTTGWGAVRGQLAVLFSSAEDIRLRVDQVAVLPLGQGGAAVVADVARTVDSGATSVRVDGVLTLVLRRQDGQDGQGGRWVIVTEHFSHPPKPR
jgi:ketosteroid isomerase-like protein